MSDVSEASLLDYFYSTSGSSGKVRNADILKTFKPFIGHSDAQLRAKYREEFKLIIDGIAVVKSENGEKYLFLKKKYRQLLQARDKDKPHISDVDRQRHSSPTIVPATALWEATDTSDCRSQQRERLDELTTSGEPDSANETALHWAAKHGNEDMATLIANAGADVNTKSGYTPLHIAALHGHRNILDLLVGTYGAKENLRDYSGHLALHYLNHKEADGPGDDCELPEYQVSQARERNRNRKLASLFHSKKKWGSAEDLAPIEEERTTSHQLAVPAFRPRKFSR
ncbi:ankyrin repeat domain-containing protein SOWAHA isoform X3 [Phyllopteryx taeniolatus]|uniref:ankyrin repeat domain-containing protein SOWAHA isoform X3 n=1 Tax=Phyllopteryx taeniolatus TaxID=161469 RepID=UPI002AD435E6|nr:ankyrin repeat domain-containing protein SOWAHA isoform X3 [Phyllopteryx taeniolatus]